MPKLLVKCATVIMVMTQRKFLIKRCRNSTLMRLLTNLQAIGLENYRSIDC